MKKRFITFLRIIDNGLISFVRNISLAIASIAIMLITLTIILTSIIINSTFNHTLSQITAKIDISIYLDNNLSPSQINSLLATLKATPDVAQVTYLDKQQVLKNYEQQNSNNPTLIQAVTETNNPLPATITIKPNNLNNLTAIKQVLNSKNVSSLLTAPPSYSGQEKLAIDRISHATDLLRQIGIVAVIVFAIISVLIIFNTIQMAIFNRREEIQTMRLLGAGSWFIKGPFIVESIVYGLLSAIISVIIINSTFQASNNALQATSFGLLDISYANKYFNANFLILLLLQIIIGVLIGSLSSYIATRKYLKFKS